MLTWLEDRTGIRQFISMMLYEGVPGGARWRYVFGSMLAFAFSIQLITGVLLMTAYRPSASQAWSSVHFIQYKMDFGWFIRGLHHFGSQTMMVLIALHMLQVVIGGAQLPPREWNWWTGIGLLSVTLGLSLTGYLLPWDQKGFWATDVATNISGTLPGFGPEVKMQAVGGPDSGNHTLTRFFALHVAILPALLIGLLVVHIVLFRKQGVTSPENPEGFVAKPANEHVPNTEPFWPRQLFYDLVACMFVFAVMVSLLFLPHQDENGDWHYGHGNAVKVEGNQTTSTYDYWARAGQRGIGANLDAPADRETANYPARPEWYFLPLFQLLKYFKGDSSIYGTVIIPNGIMLLLTLLPLFGYGPMRIVGRILGILVMVALLGGILVLIVLAMRDDEPGGIYVPHYYAAALLLLPIIAYFAVRPMLRGLAGPAAAVTFLACAVGLGASLHYGKFDDKLWFHVVHTDAKALESAKKFQHDLHLAEEPAQRSVQMAMDGTPVEGGHVMLRHDPLTAGQKLFQQKCGSCHNYTAQPGDPFKSWTGGKSASDLGNFGTEAWVRGLLHDSMTDKYFGLVKTVEVNEKGEAVKNENGNPIVIPGLTGMRGWRKGIEKARSRKKNPVDAKTQEKEFDLIAKWLAYQGVPREKRTDDKLIKEGQEAFNSDTNKCSSCHRAEFKEEDPMTKKMKWVKNGSEDAPDLSNYGSADWLRAMIMSPGHKDRYSHRNLMPAFRNLDGPGSELFFQEFRETNPNTKDHQIQHLTDIERELIVRFMQRDYHAIYGGSPIR